MASLKIVLCIALFAVAVLGDVIPSPRRDHSIDSCLNVPEGMQWTQLYSEAVQVHSKFLQVVRKEITWPVGPQEPKIIKCIRVTELLADGTGGYPTIRSGGVEYNHVVIELVSQKSHGLLYRVDILGEPAIPKPNVTVNSIV